jgi:metal-responsive CopG/Arc/MetJ family transcriptional regulator
MKQKTSITLSSDLLKEIDRMAGSKASRSAFIENVLREFFKAKVREAISARDLELINAHVDSLIRESQELDEYQAPIEWEDEEDEKRRSVQGV